MLDKGMDIDLTEKKVLLIGATEVLGFTCAEVLASEGCDLALIDSDISALKAVTTELRSNHSVNISSHAGDITDSDWQRSVLDVVQPIDFIVVDWVSLILPPNSKKSNAISMTDYERLLSIVAFCQQAVISTNGEQDAITVVSLVGSLSYGIKDQYLNQGELNTAYWPMIKESIFSYTNSLTSENSSSVRGVSLNILGSRSSTGDATEFELQVADTVSFLLSDRARAVTATTIDLHQT